MTSHRRARAVLAGVVALQLVAETALTPYWPVLFRRLFGTDELAATGSFLAVCRTTGLVALPLWGLAALRWPVRTLLVVGLLTCAVCDLALALAPTWWSFTALSATVVASGSVLVLAYPALVAVVERDGGADRRAAVVTFWAVFHTAAVAATLVGAAVVSLSQPRWGLAAFAVVDLVLALLVLAVVPSESPHRRAGRARRLRRPRRLRRRGRLGRAGCLDRRGARAHGRRLRPWLVLVTAVVAVDAALAVPRPFLVELLVRQGTGTTLAGWLFLAPAAASLAVLPLAPRLHDHLGRRCAPLAAVAAGAGLVVQAVAAAADHPGWFLAGRLLLGAAAGVLLVVLDLAVFDRVGTSGAAFGAVETGRSAALLAAPVLATAAASAWLGAPLLVGAALLAAAAALLARRTAATGPPEAPDAVPRPPARPPARPEPPEADHVPDRHHQHAHPDHRYGPDHRHGRAPERVR